MMHDDSFHDDRHRRDFQDSSDWMKQDTLGKSDSIFSQTHPEEEGQSVFDQTTEPLKRVVDVLGKIQIGMIIAMITVFVLGFIWLLLFIG